MNQTQADNSLTLAYLLRKKSEDWNFWDNKCCALGIARQNCELFDKKQIEPHGEKTFGKRVSELFFGLDILTQNDEPTQVQIHRAIIQVVGEEGWEEA